MRLRLAVRARLLECDPRTLDELLSTARFAASIASGKPMCMHCNKHHGRNQCWAKEGRCLKCGSQDHGIKECPKLKKFDPRSATTSTSKELAAEPQASAKEEDFILFPEMAPMTSPEVLESIFKDEDHFLGGERSWLHCAVGVQDLDASVVVVHIPRCQPTVGDHPLDANPLLAASPLTSIVQLTTTDVDYMASRSRRGGVPARDGEQRRDEPKREDQGEQQAPAPQGLVLPPPPPVDYGVFMQGLVQAMQTQTHTPAALQAQLEAQAQVPAPQADHGGPSIMERFKRMSPPSFKGESDPLHAESWMREIEKFFRAIRCTEDDKITLSTYMLQERADVWWSSLLHTRFEDGAVEVGWDEFALSAACHQEGDMEQYLEEMKASQKRPAAPFQRQDRKKATFQSQQRPVASGIGQVPSQCSPSGQKECPLQEGTWWYRMLEVGGEVLVVRKQRA
ncbi:hypothetical protein Taro_025794 [Colocasia esculenta]|uniref:CCHC-type domain-containing protein n=1 Tax=Colocasia esculenta TaxID=4460 RepID=A0A843VB58_COLES|nr:hypothetical protein [Colocasia esculenta]